MTDSNTLTAGVLQRISPLVARIVAPNPSVMTGPGTNTYIVGRDELAVVDVGPDDENHIQAILEQVQALGRIRWVVATHTHHDHSPGCRLLAQRTGAILVGPKPTSDDFEDAGGDQIDPDHGIPFLTVGSSRWICCGEVVPASRMWHAGPTSARGRPTSWRWSP